MPFPILHWLRAPDVAPSSPARDDAQIRTALTMREDIAAVIYERFFPTRTWGDATRSGKSCAYASADAALHVLRPYLGQPLPETRSN